MVVSSGAAISSSGAAPNLQSNDATQLPPKYFSFKDYLAPEDGAAFFDWDHDRQIDKVAEYLDFVGAKESAVHFSSSKRASTSWAELRAGFEASEQASEQADTSAVLQTLLSGRAKSGFGAAGSELGFLPQKELSLAVARSVKLIGHEYAVERNKNGEPRAPVLNSRSFFLNWCHAEKQKLMDIRLKLDRLVGSCGRQQHWGRLVVFVDREMCADCINYARSLAAAEKAHILIQDPSTVRAFAATLSDSVQEIRRT